VKALRARGVEFYVSENVHIEEKGALTRAWMGGVMFELVHDARPGEEMKPRTDHWSDFGMDTMSLAGPLESKLRAIRNAGFRQVMLSAQDLAATRAASTPRYGH
jgi:hypothetical protein